MPGALAGVVVVKQNSSCLLSGACTDKRLIFFGEVRYFRGEAPYGERSSAVFRA